MQTVTDATLWFGVMAAASFAVAPWVARLCPALPDRGMFLTAPIGMLAVVWPTWFLASLGVLPFSTVGLWLTLAAWAIGGWLLHVRRRASIRSTRSLRKALLASTGLLLSAFGLYVLFRSLQPMIYFTEKPMDMAFLASSVRTNTMPPTDPWFAGEPINYYYFGYALNGALARMASVPVESAFNLALASTFAMTVSAAVGVGYAVTRRWASRSFAATGGALTAIFIAWSGNLYGARAFADDPRGAWQAFWWEGLGWNSSRIVYDADAPGQRQTINEFPSFSFVLGDLHPHLMALPFTVVALGLAVNMVFLGDNGTRGDQPADPKRQPPMPRAYLARVAGSGAVVGALYALNSWDLPTYALICVAAIWFASFCRPARERLMAIALFAIAAVTAWAPFYVRFDPPIGRNTDSLPVWLQDLPFLPTLLTTFGPVTWSRSSLSEFLTVFGIPVSIAAIFLVLTLVATHQQHLDDRDARATAVTVMLIAGLALVTAAPVALLSGLGLMAVLEIMRREDQVSVRTVTAGLFGVGFLLCLGTEYVFLNDAFGSRYNTLFKIYFQVWTVFGLGSAVALVSLWRDARYLGDIGRRTVRPLVVFMTIVFVTLGCIYPVVGGWRYTEVWSPRDWYGLDGRAFLASDWPDELATIDWLAEHSREDWVVLEAAGCGFGVVGRLGHNRISSFTGLPTVMGWDGHQRQWRDGQPDQFADIDRRRDEVPSMYADPSGPVIDEFGVTHVVVGYLERTGDPRCPLTGPYEIAPPERWADLGWTAVFTNETVTIYARNAPMTDAGSDARDVSHRSVPSRRHAEN